jgi:hypothetical protein
MLLGDAKDVRPVEGSQHRSITNGDLTRTRTPTPQDALAPSSLSYDLVLGILGENGDYTDSVTQGFLARQL